MWSTLGRLVAAVAGLGVSVGLLLAVMVVAPASATAAAADPAPTTYALDSDQFGAAMTALALIVLLLAVQTISGWRR